jgi:hypothetical protein
MAARKELVPSILLGSGVVLTVCGLALLVAYGAAAPAAFLVILVAGVLDGLAGLIWTIGLLFSRRAGDTVDAMRRGLVLAAGLLSVIFLGTILALLLYLHVIMRFLASYQLF